MCADGLKSWTIPLENITRGDLIICGRFCVMRLEDVTVNNAYSTLVTHTASVNMNKRMVSSNKRSEYKDPSRTHSA